MKYNKIWHDDSPIDFSRKRNVHRKNSLVSKHYDKFSPEDMAVEGDTWSANPSVNKNTWEISSYFDDSLDRKSHLLNKGRRGDRHSALLFGEGSSRSIRDILLDLDEDIND